MPKSEKDTIRKFEYQSSDFWKPGKLPLGTVVNQQSLELVTQTTHNSKHWIQMRDHAYLSK